MQLFFSFHSIYFFTLPSTCVGNVSVFALDIYLDKVGQSRSIYLHTIGQSIESRFLVSHTCDGNQYLHGYSSQFQQCVGHVNQCMYGSRGFTCRVGQGVRISAYPLKFKPSLIYEV